MVKFPLPVKPDISFFGAGDHCLTDSGLRRLNEYVLRLEGVTQKYEMSVEVLNGGY